MGAERRVEADCFALDQWGVRRFVRAGDVLPEGWRVEGEGKPNENPKPTSKRKPRAS